MNKVIIYSKPRSMSTWLARFLGGYHDVSAYCKTLEDFHKYPIIVDTSLISWHEGVKEKLPDTKFYILYRDSKDCERSIVNLGYSVTNTFKGISNKVEELKETLPIIPFEKLQDRFFLKELYREVTGESCSEEYIREFLCCKIDTIPKKFIEEVNNYAI